MRSLGVWMTGRRSTGNVLGYSTNSSSLLSIPSILAVFGRTVADTNTTFSIPRNNACSAYLAGISGSNLPLLMVPTDAFVSASLIIHSSADCIALNLSNFLFMSRRCLSSRVQPLPPPLRPCASRSLSLSLTPSHCSIAQHCQSSTLPPLSGHGRCSCRHSRREISSPMKSLSAPTISCASSQNNMPIGLSPVVSASTPNCRLPDCSDTCFLPSYSQHE